jgi:hydrogenase maturation factor
MDKLTVRVNKMETLEIGSKSMGIHGRIVKINGVIGEINVDGIICETSLLFVPNIAVGDYCLVQNGIALKKVAKEDVVESFKGNYSL